MAILDSQLEAAAEILKDVVQRGTERRKAAEELLDMSREVADTEQELSGQADAKERVGNTVEKLIKAVEEEQKETDGFWSLVWRWRSKAARSQSRNWPAAEPAAVDRRHSLPSPHPPSTVTRLHKRTSTLQPSILAPQDAQVNGNSHSGFSSTNPNLTLGVPTSQAHRPRYVTNRQRMTVGKGNQDVRSGRVPKLPMRSDRKSVRVLKAWELDGAGEVLANAALAKLEAAKHLMMVTEDLEKGVAGPMLASDALQAKGNLSKACDVMAEAERRFRALATVTDKSSQVFVTWHSHRQNMGAQKIQWSSEEGCSQVGSAGAKNPRQKRTRLYPESSRTVIGFYWDCLRYHHDI